MAQLPFWMNVLLIFCAFMTVIYIPWDLFVKPVAVDVQVWFGISFHGWWAKFATLPHWVIYALGAYGFWRMRSWMWPWAAAYAGQVAFAMLIWALAHVGGWRGLIAGLFSFVPLALLTRALWQERPRFHAFRQPLGERYGGWALITGASAGIGAEFARALAADGMSCVLTARRQDRLTALAKELEKAHGVSTRVVAVDLGEPSGADRLAAAVADLDISVLVNNAGYGYAGLFSKQDSRRLRAMVELNCVTPVVLTSHLLPAMQKRRRGAVIFTGSVAGHQPVPFNGTYSATKAFDLHFGESLWAEMQGSGVDVLVLEPGPTITEFQAAAGETPHEGEPPAQVVAVALHALGHQPSVVSGWQNWLLSALARLAPRSVTALLAGRVMAQWIPADSR
jgi:hypothetical protein